MRTEERYQGSDPGLVARIQRGDRSALATLYERYFEDVYDFAARTLRDQEAAADVVQTTFVKAWQGLQRDVQVKNLRAWLYAIARNAAIDEVRRRRRIVPSDLEAAEYLASSVESGETRDPAVTAIDREAAALVWDSAAALSPSEYTLLDLHVRRGLTAEELAEHLHIGRGAIYTRLSRLRSAFEESVTAALLARAGRRECSELDSLLERFDTSELTRALRRTIKDHLDECERCQESKRRFVSPVEILAGLVPIPAASSSRASIWSEVENRTKASSPTGTGRGGPKRWWAEVLGTKGAGIALSIPIIAAIVTGGMVFGGRGGADIEDPDDVRSVSHEIGDPSEDRIVTIAWSQQPDAQGFSVDWTHGPADLPDAIADLPGTATGTQSPALQAGEWYFHLRTRGEGEEWTSTVHLGPFVIEDEPEDRVASGRIDGSRDRVGKGSEGTGTVPSGEGDETSEDGASENAGSNGSNGANGPSGPVGSDRNNSEPGDGGGSGPPEPPGDTTPPDPPLLTSVPDDPTNGAVAVWDFVGESGATFDCMVLSGAEVVFPFAPCSPPAAFDLGAKPDAQYTFVVTQTDPAGNVSAPKSDSFTLDTTPPVPPTIVNGPPDVTNDTSPDWSFRGEPGASFRCSLTGALTVLFESQPCTSLVSFDLSAAPDGFYTFLVTQQDLAGNVSDPALDTFLLQTLVAPPDREPGPCEEESLPTGDPCQLATTD